MSLVLSRLDYCSALLADIPQTLVNRVQRVTDCAARLVYKAHMPENVTLVYKVQRVINCAARLLCKAPRCEQVAAFVSFFVSFLFCGFALAASRRWNRIQYCYNLLQRDHLYCSSLPL